MSVWYDVKVSTNISWCDPVERCAEVPELRERMLALELKEI